MYTISNVLKRGANFIFLLLIARTVSVDEMGSFSAYLNVASVLLLLTNFGFHEYILVNSNNQKILKYNFSVFLVLSFSIFFILLCCSLFVPSINNLVFGMVLGKMFLDNFIYLIFLSYYQVNNSLKSITYFNLFNAFGIISLSFFCFHFQLTLELFLATTFSLSFVIVIVNSILIQPFLIKPIRILFFIRNIFPSLKYYGLSIITVPAYMMLPSLVASFKLSKTDLAIYQIAFSIANIILLVSASYIQSQYPVFLKEKSRYSSLAKKTAVIIFIFNFTVILFFSLFGKSLIKVLYDKDIYLNSLSPLIGLLFANFLQSLSSIYAISMLLNRDLRLKSQFQLEFIIIAGSLSILLINYFNIWGVVASYIILYVFTFIRYYSHFTKSKLLPSSKNYSL